MKLPENFKNRGFSLVEVLITCLILALLALPLLDLLLHGLNDRAKIYEQAQALALAQEKLEMIKKDQVLDLETEQISRNGNVYKVVYETMALPENLVKITIRVENEKNDALILLGTYIGVKEE